MSENFTFSMRQKGLWVYLKEKTYRNLWLLLEAKRDKFLE